MRRLLRHLVVATSLLLAFTSIGAAAEPKHRVLIHVDQNDLHTMDLALDNATDRILGANVVETQVPSRKGK